MKIRYGAAPVKPAKKISIGREIIEWAVVLGLAVGLAFGVRVWVGEIIVVDGPSMQPRLWKGELVITGKVEYYSNKPKRGDIVIARFPGSEGNYIKRIIGLGGEKIAVRGGSVYIDGKKLAEPYIAEPAILYDMDELAIPEDSVFLMGDNRNDSHDSHNEDIGPIPLSQIEGRAYALIWPPGEMSKLTEYTGKLDQ